MKKYMCWYAHKEPYVLHDIMVERMIESTFSFSNVYRVVDDNSNPYRNIVMNAIRMNQIHVNQCPIVYEKSNVDATRFFFDKPIWDCCTNHSKLLVVA
jgi:hypothetical protein